MPDHFFDTTVLIAYFRDEDKQSELLVENVLTGKKSAAVSAITVAELWSVQDMDDAIIQRIREAVVQLMEVVPVDASIAKRGGAIRRPHGLKLPDALIIACCHSVGGRFFSKDPHFTRLIDANEIEGEIYS